MTPATGETVPMNFRRLDFWLWIAVVSILLGLAWFMTTPAFRTLGPGSKVEARAQLRVVSTRLGAGTAPFAASSRAMHAPRSWSGNRRDPV